MPFSVHREIMNDDKSLESFRSSLDANYEWPCLFPFKFIVPKAETAQVLELFADDPVQTRESRSGRFVAYTMEMQVHSCDEVIAIYQRVAQVPGVISL
jgi:putative lipoic acid-binding regulatory protein